MTLLAQEEQSIWDVLALPAPPEQVEEVPLAAITVDFNLNVRQGPNHGIDDATVETYMYTLDQMDPIALFRLDGATRPDGPLLLADGFHRHAAATRLRRSTIRAWVFRGDRAAAELYATLANLNHGRPLTAREKKVVAARLLRQHPDLADNLLSIRAGMSPHTVRRVREELEQQQQIPVLDTLRGTDGKWRPRQYQHALAPAPAATAQGASNPPVPAACPPPPPVLPVPSGTAPNRPAGDICPPAGAVLLAPVPTEGRPLADLRSAPHPVAPAWASPLGQATLSLVLPPGPFWHGQHREQHLLVYQGDALDLLADFGESTFDLLIADPPYFRVKNEPWDQQWDTMGGYLRWLGDMCRAWRRVLKPNGSLYLFAYQRRTAALVELRVGRWFEVLNRITWKKPPFSTKAEMYRKEDLRSYFPVAEALLFAEPQTFLFELLYDYLEGERQRAGVAKEVCNAACGFDPSPGGMAARHYFNRSQWALPTAAHYAALQRLFREQGPPPGLDLAGFHAPMTVDWLQAALPLGAPWPYLPLDYAALRARYEALRRPFNAPTEAAYTDVWEFPTVPFYPGKHPCEKPVAMLEHIIRTSAPPGAVMLDCFAGSGAAGEAALRVGNCHYVAIDKKSEYCVDIRERLAALLAAAAPL